MCKSKRKRPKGCKTFTFYTKIVYRLLFYIVVSQSFIFLGYRKRPIKDNLYILLLSLILLIVKTLLS